MRVLMNKPEHVEDSEFFELPLMPVREIVMTPHSLISLFIGRETSIKALESAVSEYGKTICLVLQHEPDVEKPAPDELCKMGVVSRVLQFLRLPEGTIKVLFEGLYRVYWRPSGGGGGFAVGPFPKVLVTPAPQESVDLAESEAMVRASREALGEYARINRKLTPEVIASMSGLRDPARLSDMILPYLKVGYREKQEVLEILNPMERLEKIYELLTSELTVASMERRIKTRVKTQMERNQREYYLAEQIKAINKEMGRDEDPSAEASELEKQLAAKNMPDEAREKGMRELKKLRQMTPVSAEYSIVRNYIDWILDLPWQDVKQTELDISKARSVLDSDHFGLEKPKQRILEHLAVQKLTGSLKGSILCLVGPPGVGKTSLARSVAKATGRDYVRLSLGGVRDEAEIRGHRRTYIGAMPGKIIMSLKRAKSNNPLFCLDEIDKMSADFRGDPSSALLEVLDPEQNSSFNDHYLDLDYDLSQVFFITTANSLQNIPVPLQDRMEIIELSSYLEVEKKHIARDFLLPRQLEKHGLTPEDMRISDNALTEVIRSYTREAGVRNLERELAALCRKTAIRLVEQQEQAQQAEHIERIEQTEQAGKDQTGQIEQAQRGHSEYTEPLEPLEHTEPSEPSEPLEPLEHAQPLEHAKPLKSVFITRQSLESLLGVKKYRINESEKTSKIGVVNGLAFTGVGGVLLNVEASIMPGKGGVVTTGKIGEVMTESAKAALSYVRTRSALFGLKADFHNELDIHLHFPEGATPKDGPSAGITIITALVSALLGIPVRHDVAMTGEVTLRGRVLPIGGLREKLLAASRAGMKTVIIPADNDKDLKEVPEEILKTLEVRLVEHVDEVLPITLLSGPDGIFHVDADSHALVNSIRSHPESVSVPVLEPEVVPAQ